MCATSLGDGIAVGRAHRLRVRRTDRCSAPAARSAGAAAAGRRLLRALRRLVPRLRLPRRRARLRRQRQAGPDDGLRNDDQWDRSNVLFEDGRIIRYDKAGDRTPDMRHIDYGLGVLDALARSRAVPPDRAVRSRVGVPGPAGDRRPGRLRGHRRASTKSDRRRASRRHASISAPERDAHRDELRDSSIWQEAARVIAALDADAIERMAPAARGVARARRAAVLPRRRRQRRQLLARRQRLPQDRRHRSLRADRQRVGADRPHQRRGLGHGVRQLAQGQPAAAARTWSSSSRSAAAASRRTSARTSCARCSIAQEVGATIVGVVGRDGGYTAQVADACVIVPTVNPDTVTPHAEAFQAVVWHLLVSHPRSRRRRRNGNRHRPVTEVS